jgi:exonuclease III
MLCGDIQLNPGPCTFNVCTLNVRSLLNPLKFTAISDLAESHHIDLFALTETWISSSSTNAELHNATPPGFTLISFPRSAPTTKSHIVGGGTAFLIREPATLLSAPAQSFKSFEMSSITLKLFRSNLTVFNIYRPPPATTKTRKPVSFSDFLTDLDILLSLAATIPHEFLITGDFNLHLDQPDDSHVKQFLSVLNSTNLTQHVHFPTHRDLHTLDLVITATSTTLSPVIDYSLVSPSDHYPIFSTLTISPLPPPSLSEFSFRCLKSINISKFTRDILNSRLITHPPTNLSDLVDSYNTTLSSLLDKHAPLKTKTIRAKTPNPWFTPALAKLKSARRHLEKVWLRTRSFHDLQPLRTATNAYHSSIIRAKKLFNSSLISSSSSNPRKLWNSINKLLHRKPISQLPSSIDSKSLPHMFANFFSNKVLKLHSTIKSHFTNTSPHFQPRHIPANLTVFTPVSRDELSKLISQSSNTFCDLDPIPTSILKQCLPILLPTLTDIVNLSLSTGVFPKQFKLSSVIPLLKKYNLDKEELSNYRPISHLSFLSKLTERVVKQRLTHHLSSNHLLNSFQSAYTTHHSTESTLLSVHDHIIKAMAQQRITALCLLDLSAAFDTIDHSILIHRLSSWFGLNGTVLSWLHSYISSRHFVVNIKENLSDPLPLHQGVPQGSVLGPLLFILYTTPLSSLISDSSVKHHLYADDTQLFISFSALDFALNIAHLKTTINNVSTWMSANLLSLNQSKTEFLLIGLPKQLSKISDPTLLMPSNVTITPTDSARNLGVIFDSSLTFSDHISSVSKSCFQSIRDLRRIRNTLDHSTAQTIATSLIHSKVDYCNSLFLNLPRCQLDRLQLILNSAARAVSKTPRFSHISPILKSLHWLKIDQRIQYKVLSLTYKTLQSQKPSYLYNLLNLQANTSTRSSTVITLQRPPVNSRLKISDRSFTHHAPALWNSLPKDLRYPVCRSSSTNLSASTNHLLALSASQFHSRLKTHLFLQSFPP